MQLASLIRIQIFLQNSSTQSPNSKMSADALSQSSRSFYERTRFKMAASIFLAAMGMMALAYVSTFGGMSNAATYMMDVYDNNADDEQYQAQLALSGGYGRL